MRRLLDGSLPIGWTVAIRYDSTRRGGCCQNKSLALCSLNEGTCSAHSLDRSESFLSPGSDPSIGLDTSGGIDTGVQLGTWS